MMDEVGCKPGIAGVLVFLADIYSPQIAPAGLCSCYTIAGNVCEVFFVTGLMIKEINLSLDLWSALFKKLSCEHLLKEHFTAFLSSVA